MRSRFDPIAVAAAVRHAHQSISPLSTFASRHGAIALIAAAVREAIASSVLSVSDGSPRADFQAATRNIWRADNRPLFQIDSRMSSPGSSW